MTADELREELVSKGLKTTGNKTVMTKRLVDPLPLDYVKVKKLDERAVDLRRAGRVRISKVRREDFLILRSHGASVCVAAIKSKVSLLCVYLAWKLTRAKLHSFVVPAELHSFVVPEIFNFSHHIQGRNMPDIDSYNNSSDFRMQKQSFLLKDVLSTPSLLRQCV